MSNCEATRFTCWPKCGDRWDGSTCQNNVCMACNHADCLRIPPLLTHPPTQSFHQHEGGSWGMRTCQIAKPPSTPAGQSVGVGGMKAHACKICACLAIIPIVFIFNKGALIGEPTRHGHHSHEYSVTDRRHSIQQVHYSRSGSLDHVNRTSFAPLACTTRYPKPPLGTPLRCLPAPPSPRLSRVGGRVCHF